MMSGVLTVLSVSITSFSEFDIAVALRILA